MKLAGGSVDLPPQTLVDLDGPAPKIVLTGLTTPLSGGETVQLILTFANAGAVTLSVPVEPHAYDYATYSPPPTRRRRPARTAQAARGRPSATVGVGLGVGTSATRQPVDPRRSRYGGAGQHRSVRPKDLLFSERTGVSPVSGLLQAADSNL